MLCEMGAVRPLEVADPMHFRLQQQLRRQAQAGLRGEPLDGAHTEAEALQRRTTTHTPRGGPIGRETTKSSPSQNETKSRVTEKSKSKMGQSRISLVFSGGASMILVHISPI